MASGRRKRVRESEKRQGRRGSIHKGWPVSPLNGRDDHAHTTYQSMWKTKDHRVTTSSSHHGGHLVLVSVFCVLDTSLDTSSPEAVVGKARDNNNNDDNLQCYSSHLRYYRLIALFCFVATMTLDGFCGARSHKGHAT